MSTLESTSLLTYQNALNNLGINNNNNNNNNNSSNKTIDIINDSINSIINDTTTTTSSSTTTATTTTTTTTTIVHDDDVIAVMSQMLDSVEYIISISYNASSNSSSNNNNSSSSSSIYIEPITSIIDDSNNDISDTNLEVSITNNDNNDNNDNIQITETSPWLIEKLLEEKRKKHVNDIIEEQTRLLLQEEDDSLKELERDKLERIQRKKKFLEEMNRVSMMKSAIKIQKYVRGRLVRIRTTPLLILQRTEREEREKRAIGEALAEEEARLKALAEAEEARLKALAEAEEAARVKAAEDARLKAEAEEEARLKAEEEARLKAAAEEEARLIALAEEEARLKAAAEQEERLKALAEKEARLKAVADEETRQKALTEEAKRKSVAQEQAKLKSGKNQITPNARPSWGGSVAPVKKVNANNIEMDKTTSDTITESIETTDSVINDSKSLSIESTGHTTESSAPNNNIKDLSKYWQNLVSSNLVTTTMSYLGAATKIKINSMSLLSKDKSNKSSVSCMTPLMRGLMTWTQHYSSFINTTYDQFEHDNDTSYVITDDMNKGNDDELLERLGLRVDPSQVKKIKLNVEGLSSSQFLRRFEELKSLELNVNKIRNLNGLAGLKFLTYLSINDNGISSIDPLCRIKSLQDLRLDSNNINSLKAIEKLKELKRLSAKVNNLVEFPNLSCTCLQKLELYQNKIIMLGDNCLLSLPKLMHLDVGCNKLEYVSGLALSRCHLLQTLVLSQNKLTEVPANLYLPQLKTLWLSGNKLKNLYPWTNNNNDTNWPVFLPMLQKLYLNDNNINIIDNGCFDTCPLLSLLDLSFNDIQCADDLVALRSCLILKTIELSDNPILNDTNSHTILNQFIRQYSKHNNNIDDDTSIETKISNTIMKMNTNTIIEHDNKSTLNSRKFIEFLNIMIIEQNNFFLKEKLERDDDDDEHWSDNIIKSLNKQLLLLHDWTNSIMINKGDAFVIKYYNEVIKEDDDRNNERFYMNNVKYVIKIQAAYRGYIRRKKLKKVMLSSRYIDNDIEEIMMDDDFIDGMNLDESPELQSNWFSNRDSKWLNEKEYDNAVINDDDDDNDDNDNDDNDDNINDNEADDEAKDNELNENVSSNFDSYYNSSSTAMAYGDHIRRRQNNNSGGGLRTLSAEHPTIQIEDFKENLSRPSTAMTSASTITTTSKAYSEQEDEFLSRFKKDQKKAENVDEVAKEWGVTNPKVAAMIMKRNKRMKGFQAKAQKRETEKSASERFDRFVRTNVRVNNSSTAK